MLAFVELFLMEVGVKILARYPRWLMRMLAEVEFGVGLACERQAKRARADGKPGIAEHLHRHALDEFGHAGILYRELGEKPPVVINQSVQQGYDSEIDFGDGLLTPKKYGGLAHRLAIFRAFFGGQSLSEMDWPNTLAAMAILETTAEAFYERLEEVAQGRLKEIAHQLRGDERHHASYLRRFLAGSLNHDYNRAHLYLVAWNDRKTRAIAALPWMLIKGELFRAH